jgi:wyosine [tRNA(Phe)-imidazoG37] synthetase (radical SAM superfamily)
MVVHQGMVGCVTHIPHVCLQDCEFCLVTPTGNNDHKLLQGTAKSSGVEE